MVALADLDPRMNDAHIELGEGLRLVPLQDDKHSTYIGMSLMTIDGVMVSQGLIQNSDLFAWTASDMSGVSPEIITHLLSVYKEVRPITQKKRKMGEEKHNALKNETDKLLEADFIQEVQYTTWLANVVMVKKANGKWRMCTDYIDLSKGCPKDAYPLLSIDRLVDGATGHRVLSFLDAYSEYN